MRGVPGLILLSLALFSVSSNAQEATLELIAQSADSVTVDYSGTDSADDWVGIYPLGGVDGQLGGAGNYETDAAGSPLIAYATDNGLLSGQALTSGELTLDTSSLPDGDYDLRLVDGGYVTLRVVVFTVDSGTPGSAPALSVVSQSDVDVTVSYSGTDSADDWVGVYPLGGVDGQLGGAGNYERDSNGRPLIVYATDDGTLSGVARDSGELTLETDSLEAGEYDLRLIDGGYTTLKVATFTVSSGPTQTPTLSVISQSASDVTVAYSGADSSDDWVGVYPLGGVDGQRGGAGAYELDGNGNPLIVYTTNDGTLSGGVQESGQLTLATGSLAAGSYDLRLIDGGYVTLKVTTFNVGSGGNEVPSAAPDSAIVNQGTTTLVNVLANDGGLGDTPISLNIIDPPAAGSASVTGDNRISYSADAAFTGDVEIEYRVSDNDGESDTAVLTVTVVGGPNQLPSAQPDDISMTQGDSVEIDVLANDSGLGDTPIGVTIVSEPNNGTAAVDSGNQVTYTPNVPNETFLGNDSFEYRVTDADNESATATVSVSVDCPANGPCERRFVLSWNPVSFPELAGYCVYHDISPRPADAVPGTDLTSRHYFDRECIGNVTSYEWTLPVTTGTDYFAVTTRATNGDESAYSTEFELVSF